MLKFYKELVVLLLSLSSVIIAQNFYQVELDITGRSQLTIFEGSVSALQISDEIGVFDAEAITNYNDCSNQIGELLVGAGIWTGEQLEIISVGSVDNCAFGGPQLPGYVEGNEVNVRVYRPSTGQEFAANLTWSIGTGEFGDILQSVSDITLIDPNACDDDPSAVSAFGGCAGAIAALTCEGVFFGNPISDYCPVSCDACPEVPVLGCTDSEACNYDETANEDDGSCSYAQQNYDCDGNFIGNEDGIVGDEPNTLWLVDNGNGTYDVGYWSTNDIGGFQFVVDGTTINNASGGDATSAGFMVSASGSTVLGFSMTGGTITAGDPSVLLTLDLAGTPTGLSGITFSDYDGMALDFTYDDGSPVLSTCDDMMACNFGDEGDCSYPEENYDCDGICVTEIDCAGVCQGDSITDDFGNCCFADEQDCAGLCFGASELDPNDVCCLEIQQDCNGVCDGPAITVTYCEDTDGDGLGNPGTEIEGCVDGTRDITDGCDLPENNIYLNSDGSVVYNSSVLIGGFQFNVDGATINSASGGDAGDAGMMISPAGNMVLGFSMTGGTFGLCGTMINLDLAGDATGLSDFIISDASGSAIGFVYYEEPAVLDLVEDCSDFYPDCTSNVVDCAGVCDGTSEEDCAGVCGGENIEDLWGECCLEEEQDCNGVCGGIAEEDCAGVCGGTSLVDDCGVCGGDGTSCIINNGCDLNDYEIILTSEGEVLYNIPESFSGFQFDIDGPSILNTFGGDAEAAGFSVNSGFNRVFAFSTSFESINGCGTLTNLNLQTDSAIYNTLTNVIISSNNGSKIYGAWSGDSLGCTNENACNFDSNADEDDGSCEVDFNYCGIVSEYILGDLNSDTIINVLDVVEQINYILENTSELETYCLGDTNNDSNLDILDVVTLWNHIGGIISINEELEFGCNEDGLVGDEPNTLWLVDNDDGTYDVGYWSTDDIGGFQFEVDGTTINSVSGGDATSAGLMLSAGVSTVLGFSMTGASIAAGDPSVLLTLDLAGTPTGLSGITISDASGSALDFSYDDGSSDPFPTCDDSIACNFGEEGECIYPEENFDCDGICVTELDCNGVCGGTAELDCAGTCDGSAYEAVLCEDTDGDGLGNPGTETIECIIADCSNASIWDDCSNLLSGGYYTCQTLIGLGYDCSFAESCGLCPEACDDPDAVNYGSVGDCVYTCAELGNGYVDDCADNDCCPEGWIGDGVCDGVDQGWGCDLTCYDYDGGDCEGTLAAYDGPRRLNVDSNIVDSKEYHVAQPINKKKLNYENSVFNGTRDIIDGCDLPENNIYLNSDGSIVYHSSDFIGGFQINIDGATIVNEYDGDANSAGFMNSFYESTILGFSLSGATFGPCGTLVNLELEGNATGLSEFTISDAFGSYIDFVYYQEPATFDLVMDCSDEYPDCADNYIDCNGECGGSAVQDCNGVCGGSGEYDECGVCDGDGSGCLGINLSFVNVTESSLDIYMVNELDLAGFQIELTGINITGATGGSAADAEFLLSASGSTVLGFSMVGSTIPAGEGVLVSLSYDNPITEICFSESTVMTEPGSYSYIPTSFGDCYTPPSSQSQIQFIHNSASSTVDVYVDGAFAIEGFEYRTATSVFTLPTSFTVAIAPAGGEVIATFPFELEDGGSYVVVATGLLGDEYTPFDLAATSTTFGASSGDVVGLEVYHGSTDAPSVDILADANDGSVLVPGLAYGSFSGYVEVPAADYTLGVAPAGSDAIAAFTVPLSGLGGGSAVAFASGFLAPTGDDPEFGVFAALVDGTVLELPALGQDCTGTWGGDAVVDDCGVCEGYGFDCGPSISVNQDFFYEVLFAGQTSEQYLEISNYGISDLEWELEIIDMNRSESANNIGFYADETRSQTDEQLSLPSDESITYSTGQRSYEDRGTGDILGEYQLQLSSEDGGLAGMVWAEGYLFGVNYNSSLIEKYDPFSYELLEVFPVHNAPYGIVWDGNYLFIGSETGNIYGYDLDGVQIGSLSSPIFGLTALAWDGEYFLVSEVFQSDSFYRIDYTGSVIEQFSVDFEGSEWISQLVWVPGHENGNLWTIDWYNDSYSESVLRRIDLNSGIANNISTYFFPYYSGTYAITHDGTDLWIGDWNGFVVLVDDGVEENSSLDWLSVSSDEGIIAPGESTTISLMFNAPLSNYDTRNADIVINSNDPFSDHIVIGVDLTVNEFVSQAPTEFTYNLSTEQAFYYFENAYDINGLPLVPGEDWIGAFNGDVCVGAREWSDDSLVDIPVMGNDGYFYSDGYMNSGDYPTFKIYDASLDMIFVATASDQYPFENLAVYTLGELTLTQSYEFDDGTNLISFLDLPEDNSLAGLFNPIYDNVSSIIGESISAIPFDGGWVGSLDEIECTKGYWLRLDGGDTSLSIQSSGNCSMDQEYSLSTGPNLVSYPLYDNQTISGSLPDYVEDGLVGIISDGSSAIIFDGEWVGSLTGLGLSPKNGYWFISNDEMNFTYEIEDDILVRRPSINQNLYRQLPTEFFTNHSTVQASVFIKEINTSILTLDEDDIVLAYCKNQLVGARYWSGELTDISIMGADNHESTVGYCELGEKVSLKYFDSLSGDITDLVVSDGPVSYEPNTIQILHYVDVLPSRVSISKVYPNPFNPVTTIEYELNSDVNVNISVYDITGGHVDKLVNNFQRAGYHNLS